MMKDREEKTFSTQEGPCMTPDGKPKWPDNGKPADSLETKEKK